MASQRPGGLYLLSGDPVLRQHVAAAAASLGRVQATPESALALGALVETAKPCAVILDHADPRGAPALLALERVFAASPAPCIVVVPEVSDDVARGADVICDVAALPSVLRAVGRPSEPPARSFETLLGVSSLGGPIDEALRRAEAGIADGFGVARGVLALGDTDDPVHARVRASLACDATVIVATETGCASYLGVAFDDRADGLGCLGLIADGVRIFSDADRAALEAVSARLGHEMAWRGTHERSAAALDRVTSTAGIDTLTGTWNRQALVRLTAMYLSTSMRFKQALGVIVIDLVDLHGINQRRGLGAGDALLQRIGDATRAQTRIEDVVGRWAPGMVVAILQGTSLEGAHRAAARIKQRSEGIELRFGVCVAHPNEDAASLLDRATQLAKRAAPGLPARVQEAGDEVGTTLGGSYRLLHEIGQGGMGLVYRAEDLALERPVAIKMLRPDLVDDHEIVEQLRSEASLLARLQHPNLVQVYSFAQGGGDAYIVMELVEGECLLHAIERNRLENTTLPLADVIAITTEIGSALDALHDHGVIHRDVKPANVIRDPFRARSVLVDVGIARRFGQLVETAGTPGYVAPEVIRGDEATHLSDVYGFASTLYSLLTLASPWPDEERVATLTRQASGEEPTSLSLYRPELAVADELMRSALSSDPRARPASAGAFARGMATALAGLAPAPPDRASERDRGDARVILPRRSQAAQMRTRGIVFRSVARAIGVREAERLRDRLAGDEPELARALSDAAPLEWQPTVLFTRLLALAPTLADRDGVTLARDVARATARASFRRFFPASPATLMPDRTLSVMRAIWSRYHTWGTVSSMPRRSGEVVVRIGDTPRNADLCGFASGLLEQMVTLSGGEGPHVEHEKCEARGDAACLFAVSWERAV